MKKTMKKTIFIALAALLSLPFGAAAQEAVDSPSSSVAMPFLSIPRETKSLSMAGSDLFGGASSMLRDGSRLSAGASYLKWMGSGVTPYGCVNADVAYNTGGNVAVKAFISIDKGSEYELITEDGTPGETYSPNNMVVGANVAFAFTKEVAADVTVKRISQSIAPDASFSAFAADVILSAKLPVGVKLAGGVKALGTPVKEGVKKYSLPMSAVVSAGYANAFSDSFALDAEALVEYYMYGALRASAGVEAEIVKMVYVRGGYNLGLGDSLLPSFASAGLGVKYSMVKAELAYATLFNTISLGVRVDL